MGRRLPQCPQQGEEARGHQSVGEVALPSAPSCVSPGWNLEIVWEAAKSHLCPAVGTGWKIQALGEVLDRSGGVGWRWPMTLGEAVASQGGTTVSDLRSRGPGPHHSPSTWPWTCLPSKGPHTPWGAVQTARQGRGEGAPAEQTAASRGPGLASPLWPEPDLPHTSLYWLHDRRVDRTLGGQWCVSGLVLHTHVPLSQHAPQGMCFW